MRHERGPFTRNVSTWADDFTWGESHGSKMWQPPQPPFIKVQMTSRGPRYLIVCVENPAGIPTLNELAGQAETLGLRWIGTLGQQLELAGVENSSMVDQLPHRFAILEILSGNEAMALRELYRLECSLKRDKNLPPFLSIEPDYPLRYSIPAKIGANYDLKAKHSKHDDYCNLLKIDDAHSNGIEGEDVAIAVVDSGVEKQNIASKFQDLYKLKNNAEIDANGHGTAMTSIIHDVARKSTVTAIRISDGFPAMWRLMNGVASASFGFQADIINISMGLDIAACSQCGSVAPGVSNTLQYFLKDVSEKAVSSNGPPLLVASTGNEDLNEFSCPAKWDFMVAVGAINSSQSRSRFSNYGDSSHPAFIVMPGGDTDSNDDPAEWIGEGDDGKCLGTSPAAAYASAVLALYYSDLTYRNSNRQIFLDSVLKKCDDTFSTHDANEHGKGYLPYVK